MPVAAIYARVSTSGQDCAAQLHELREYAQRRGWDAVEFVDEGVSGALDSRPALDEMMAAAKQRRVDVVVATKLDRLGRSVLHLAGLAAELDALGVNLAVLGHGIDTTTPIGRLTYNIIASMAEFERALIQERTKAGLAAAARKGRFPGRPRALDAKALRRIRRLRDSGHPLRYIAELVGVSHPTVMRALARGTEGPTAPS